MGQRGSGIMRQGVELRLEVGEQCSKVRAVVIVRDRPADRTPSHS
jgi:hypothetical protein